MKGKILKSAVFLSVFLALVNGVSRFILGRVFINTFWYHLSDAGVLIRSENILLFFFFLIGFFILGWGIKKITSRITLIGLLGTALLSILCYPALYLPKSGNVPYQFQPFFPALKTIKLPQEKKNLIFIFAESLESTYQDTTVFGKNLIPKLSTWTENNVHFNHFVQLNGTEFTSAAYISMLCGLPLFVDLQTTFSQHPLCVPNILKANGYRMTFLKGAILEFGRTHQTAQYMEFDKSLGYTELLESQRISPEEIGFKKWMLTMPPDRKLFQIAQEEIIDLARQNAPFMIAITTADTHFPMGYLDKACPRYTGDMQDVIQCTDDTLASFLTWVEQQPFYENTLVVMVGDHLSMKSTIYDKLMSAKERGIYNVFIHAPKPPKTNRTFTSFDIGPTLLEMLGFNVPVLGYGKSLMQKSPTLIEEAPEAFEDFLALGKPIKNQSGFYKGKKGLRHAQGVENLHRIRRKIGRHHRTHP